MSKKSIPIRVGVKVLKKGGDEVGFSYKVMSMFNNLIQHYNHDKYWKFQEYVIGRNSNKSLILRYYYFFRIKRMESFNNASSGTAIGKGAYFKNPPILPHGLKGIFINPNAVVGENCRIYQQVTIGHKESNGKAPIIGDNCIIGAGAKIIGNITIGNNVNIGANCVVFTDIPDNATVVLEKPRIIIKK